LELSTEAENTPKSGKKPDKKKKKSKNSFFKNLKGILSGESGIEEDKKGDNQTDHKTSSDASVKVKNKISDSTKKPDKAKDKPKQDSPNPEEDPTIYLFNNFKDHEKIQSLRKRKETIIKVTASIVSVILIIIGIVYSITPNENVASNVIFGERAMFSAFLILIAFLILAAVFSRRLLEGKYLKNIHKDLEIAEGKKPKDQPKNSHPDHIIEGMNKKNK
jgi:hypothetical protein